MQCIAFSARVDCCFVVCIAQVSSRRRSGKKRQLVYNGVVAREYIPLNRGH